ncbi:hypothetical protein VPH35_139140 [Triticum aestivum]|uniref:uncharacterized protein isoform X2 n=1 Tax=Triticum aestivum TaxID=4565 RepID=UPI00084294D8|nr:uncharacterized protein LOC123164464 isoform X2 [Triticum aestivum]
MEESFTAPSVDPPSVDLPDVDPASVDSPAVDPASVDSPAVDPASFHPPAVDPASANPSRYPSWVLLDSRAYFAHPINATTVKATTSTGHNFEVTFCLARPPAVSYFCVHFPGINVLECCITEPRVISSANDLALLCFPFRTGTSSTYDYFVYRAASSKPTIRSVPCPPPTYRHSWHAAIVSREDGSFLVADLSLGRDLGHYNLHIFSSVTDEWSTQHVQLKEHPGILPKLTHKVISLGEGTVGWVDLWRGIVVCDVLQKDPVLRFIPLPRPLPKADYDEPPESQALADYDARSVRDVTGFPNGFIDFIEIEHCFKWSKFINMRSFKTTAYLDFLDTISDNDLLRYHEEDIMEDKIKCAPDGWKIRTGFRSISWNHWRKGYNFHVDDISAEPQLALQLLHLWDSRTEKCRVRNLKTTPGFPTFTIYGRAIVLMSKVGVDQVTWMLGVDLLKKSLEVIKPYHASRVDYYNPTFISCEFSKYLNTAPIQRLYDEQVAAESAQNEEVAAESAQNGVPNDQLPLGDTVPKQCVPSSEMCKLTMVPPLMPPRPVQLAQPLRSKVTVDE